MNTTPDGNHAVIEMNPENYKSLATELAAVETPKPGTPINQFELRGYELAKLLPDGSWEKVATYRPTNRGLGEANSSCTWLNQRHPEKTYQVRGVISAELPRDDGKLVLDADEPSAEAGGGLTGVATDLGDAADFDLQASTPLSDLGGEG